MSKPSFLFLMVSIPLVFCRYQADPCSEPFALLDCEALPYCFMSDPPYLGPCKAYMPRWSYNQETGNCEYFIYGGCGASNNIFYSQQECADTCVTTVDPCSEPFGIEADPSCEAFYPTWSYNQDTGKCEKWIYGGCGGNNNRFEGTKGMKECQETCEATSAAGLDDLEQLCSLDNDVGKRNVQIVDKINQYRSQIGKSQLKCIGALVSTAEHHTRNQMDANPSSGNCNLHSWLSDKHLGKGGKKCCYKDDHSNPNCMWKKPEEILGWDGGYGYEISYASSGGAKPDDAFKAWRHSSGHNDVMASNGMWKSLTKVGCYYEGNYANCWFAM